MVKYYPPVANIAKLVKEYKDSRVMVNFAEAQRLQDVEEKKRRGKGAPTKAKDKGLSGVFRASRLVDIIRRAESQDSQETVVGGTTNYPYLFACPSSLSALRHSSPLCAFINLVAGSRS